VRNTPISEAGFTGLAVGRALAGKKTVVEIMFGDFCTLIIDQLLQHADKFPHDVWDGRRAPVDDQNPDGRAPRIRPNPLAID
jgi:pyruvate/2-oxoglutarate/acetoin dehydrogenase E1 component